MTDMPASFFLWPLFSVALYLLAKALHRRLPRWWNAPVLSTPVFLLTAVMVSGQSYASYFAGSHFLVMLLGPCTVAFAVPVYQQRRLIQRHWRLLASGSLVGSGVALFAAWAMAHLFGLDHDIVLSLVPRSISMPFALAVSSSIGGVPELTAVFVVLTGVFGAIAGGFMLRALPLHSATARGAMLGMGAHGAGVARAFQAGPEEGAIAGLTMILVGLLNALLVPLLFVLFRTIHP